jgi:hypothetical protein
MRRSFMAMALTASLVSTAPSGLFDPLWALFSSLWETKEGCGMDPSGRCLPASKAGCEMDPDGRCLTAPKAGCELDPYGRCNPGS